MQPRRMFGDDGWKSERNGQSVGSHDILYLGHSYDGPYETQCVANDHEPLTTKYIVQQGCT